MHRYTADFVIYQDDVEIHRSPWLAYPAQAELGWACDHDFWNAEQFDDPGESCGWCESQGNNGTPRAAIIVECPNCHGVMAESMFLSHLIDDCGQ